jgi:hypothetical protein
MKTEVTIPWEAVVKGRPPSAQTPGLPLVVSTRFAARGDGPTSLGRPGTAVGVVLDAVAGADPMAVAFASPCSTLIELCAPAAGAVAMLTSDGRTSVVLQATYGPLGTTRALNPAVRRDAFARSYVARHARLDPDVRAFVLSDTGHAVPANRDENPAAPDAPAFVNPRAWGFELAGGAYHWTAHSLFKMFATSTPSRTTKSLVCRPPAPDLFDESATPDRGDPFRCVPQLRQLRTLCEQASHDASPPLDLSHRLAVALGRCRLFGVRVPAADDCALAPVSFALAAVRLCRHLSNVAHWLMRCGCGLTDRSGAYVDRHVAADLLEIRTDAHCAYLALDEAYAAALYDGSPHVPSMSRRLHQVRRLINLFDGNLQKNIPLLRPAASTYLLDNWRRLLAPTYRDCPPWWLDGSIG